MKYLKYLVFTAILVVINSCGMLPEDYYIESYTNIYSYNLDTRQITEHCNIGRDYSDGFSYGDPGGDGKYYYSPDGSYFISTTAFLLSKYNESINISSYDINTKEQIVNLVDSLPTIYNSYPEIIYSNNGQNITFSDSLIYTVNVDGTNLKSHTAGRYPTFSPDDTKILFLNENGFISTVDIENNTVSELISDDEIRYPSFHPEGDKIYYFSEYKLKSYRISDSTSTTITTFNYFSGDLIKFSDSGDHKVIGSHVSYSIDENDIITELEGIDYAKISPDGTKIAYYYQSSLWTMDFNGTNQQKISSARMGVDNISFTKDGSRIFYIALN